MNKPFSQLLKDASDKIAELKHVTSRFSEWYAEHGCPFTDHDICLGGEKERYEKEQLEEAEEDRLAFNKEYDCGKEVQGSCWAKYYKKEWRDKQTKKKSLKLSNPIADKRKVNNNLLE